MTRTPTFRLVDDETGIPDASVTIYQDDEIRWQGTTDNQGIASVAALDPGSYWLEVKKFGVVFEDSCFHVNTVSGENAEADLVIEVSNIRASVKRLRGRLVQSGTGETLIERLRRTTAEPIEQTALTLRNLITGESVTAMTDNMGEFLFPVIPEGVYVMHIPPADGPLPRGDWFQAIRIRNSSGEDQLQLTFSNSLCGLGLGWERIK